MSVLVGVLMLMGAAVLGIGAVALATAAIASNPALAAIATGAATILGTFGAARKLR